MIMDGVITPVMCDPMTAEVLLSLTLAIFGVVSVGVFVVMWVRGELSDNPNDVVTDD